MINPEDQIITIHLTRDQAHTVLFRLPGFNEPLDYPAEREYLADFADQIADQRIKIGEPPIFIRSAREIAEQFRDWPLYEEDGQGNSNPNSTHRKEGKNEDENPDN